MEFSYWKWCILNSFIIVFYYCIIIFYCCVINLFVYTLSSWPRQKKFPARIPRWNSLFFSEASRSYFLRARMLFFSGDRNSTRPFYALGDFPTEGGGQKIGFPPRRGIGFTPPRRTKVIRLDHHRGGLGFRHQGNLGRIFTEDVSILGIMYRGQYSWSPRPLGAS